MFAQERHQAISDLLERQHKATVAELQSALGASPATLRRDLAELETGGKVIRVRGAVVHPAYFRGEPTLAQKSRAASGAKRDIAAAAASLVTPGSTVFIDAGSTCLALGQLLLTRSDVTIVTHSLPLVALAAQEKVAAKVICLGGEVRAVSGALVDSLSLAWLKHMYADWCFIGASGLSANEGASTTELREAAMKQALLQRAKHKVLLADERKWDKPATVLFAPWNEFEAWVTDADPVAVRAVKKLGPRVLSVRKEQRQNG
ncbi:MAG TPA: DeoR/GlpR family DNA-binding transcription regulator [Abditibacteriaceae bacterium]|jgi:DeoR/GlpR family transcriptional regulator of sugar metabolism